MSVRRFCAKPGCHSPAFYPLLPDEMFCDEHSPAESSNSQLYRRLMAIAESFTVVAVKVDEGRLTGAIRDPELLSLWLDCVEETLETLNTRDERREG